MMGPVLGTPRRDIMAVSINTIAPVAHLPLVLGVLRKIEVAAVIDAILSPMPRNVLSSGRGVEALVLAILEGIMRSTKWANGWKSRACCPSSKPT
jgi:hypothetical protein